MVETGQICLNILIDRMRCPSSAVKRLLKLTPKISVAIFVAPGDSMFY